MRAINATAGRYVTFTNREESETIVDPMGREYTKGPKCEHYEGLPYLIEGASLPYLAVRGFAGSLFTVDTREVIIHLSSKKQFDLYVDNMKRERKEQEELHNKQCVGRALSPSELHRMMMTGELPH